MNINISKGIDLDKLHAEIGAFQAETNKYPYLFVNEETMINIIKTVSVQSWIAADTMEEWQNGRKGEYSGYKIYCDNDLKFGEIEIR